MKKLIETVTKNLIAESNAMSSEHHSFFTKKGFKHYNHGPRHAGFIDDSESKLSVKDAHAHLIASGYQHTDGYKDKIATYRIYSKPAAPYSEHSVSIESKNGTHVWNAVHNLRRYLD